MKKPDVSKKYRLFFIETAKQRILDILFRFPIREFSLTELSKEARVAKANMSNILKELENLDFVKIKKFNNLWRISANQASEQFRASKIIYNLNYIVNSGLVDFLNEHYSYPRAIILFGSFRKGDDISNSDIDIAIEDLSVKTYNLKELKELEKFEKIFGKKIQIHLFNPKKINFNLFNNIVNGIVLSGFLDIEKWKKK